MELFNTLIMATFTGFITYVIGRAKTKKEVEGIELANIEKTLHIYQEIITDLQGQISTLLIKVDDLESKICQLQTENKELKEMLENANTKTTR